MKKLLAALVLIATTLRAADGPQAALSEGIALMGQGDFQSAVLKLDEAARGLATDATKSRELTSAYLFLGMSYVELNQELNAKAKFREVLKKDKELKLSEAMYSKQIIRVFEATRAEVYPKKKNRFLPLLWIAGGGTAAAGVAIAASGGEEPTTTAPTTTTPPTTGGGGGGGSTTTTTTVATNPGDPTRTPTPTTLPGATPTPTPTGPTATPTPTPTGPTATPTPTPIGPTATPTPTPIGPTATPTPTPIGPTATPTATPTPTPPPTPTPTPTTVACNYSMAPPSVNILLLGGAGTCTVTTNLPSCPWTAQASDSWIQMGGQTSGPGNGAINWSAGLTLLARTGEITLSGTQGSTNARCQIVQGGVVPPPERTTTDTAGAFAISRLDVAGARAQVTVNGTAVHFQATGDAPIATATQPGPNRVVAQIVTAAGRPGTWRFDLAVPILPGSLRAEAGEALSVTEGSIVFRFAGRPGERVVFSFHGRP